MSLLRPALTWLLIWLLAFAAPAQAVQNMLILDAALSARAAKTGLIRDQVIDHNGDYGDVLVDQGTVYNPYRWNGEPLDAESGLTYMRNRYYQAATGRFIQRDPIGYAGGLNLYRFCGSDPIQGSDPNGTGPGSEPGPDYDPNITVGEWAEGFGYGLFAAGAVMEFFEFAAPAAAYSWSRWAARGPASPTGNLVNAAVEEEVTGEAITGEAAAGEAAPSAPTEPYSRRKHYPNSPTAADRKAVGAGKGQVADHDPPLVKRYYEGDPNMKPPEKPGFQMTPAERAASAADRSRMSPQAAGASNSQGGTMAKYSREMRKKWFGF